jgi:hypothetical protein
MSGVVEDRRVQIQPLSARTELLLVLRASMAITVGVWLYVASSAGIVGSGGPGQRNLLPFQKVVADRPFDEQRMFRELQEGLLEAEASRSQNLAWPSVQSLAEEGIPPFAADPTMRSTYRWQLLQGGTLVNYLGIPRAPEESAWLLLVQEPEPGAPPDPAGEDEEHHRLVNGPMLHVSTWVRSSGQTRDDRLVRLPQAEGWTQLYAVGPAGDAPGAVQGR